jgi:hypothetical protein
MDFDDTSDEAAWRGECRGFLERQAQLKPERVDWGESYWAKTRTPEEEAEKKPY